MARSIKAQVVTASTFTLPSAPVKRTWRSKRAPLGGSGTGPLSGAPAPTKDTKYPPLGDLWAHLDRTHARLKGMVESASEKDLDRPPREPNDFFKSLGQAAYEISLHETYHVGSIATLRKAHGKPGVA